LTTPLHYSVMTDGPSSEFIDNTDVELREVFRETLTNSEEVRVAAGYFRLSGFAPLAAEAATG